MFVSDVVSSWDVDEWDEMESVQIHSGGFPEERKNEFGIVGGGQLYFGDVSVVSDWCDVGAVSAAVLNHLLKDSRRGIRREIDVGDTKLFPTEGVLWTFFVLKVIVSFSPVSDVSTGFSVESSHHCCRGN